METHRSVKPGPDFTFLLPVNETALSPDVRRSESDLPGKPDEVGPLHRRRTDRRIGPVPIPRGIKIYFRRQTDDLPAVLTRFNKWWDALCHRNLLNPRSEFCEKLGYHVVELVKNALRSARQAKVETLFQPEFIAVMIIDDGEGIADPSEDVLISLGGGHGLQNAIRFSDWFSLETKGRTFEKGSRYGPLREVGVSDIKEGTRIHLIRLRQ